MNYYNEIDPYCCEWLKNLIDEGLIPKGKIDDRSIADVEPGDLSGFKQCHFFAGIGGWSRALDLAGWPKDKEVWTGSCPCQPFSAAGKKKGTEDERHLWPELLRLISKCRPATAFGEQVASELGRQWLSGVFVDLEDLGYAVAGADLCAAGVGSPQIRQRLYWVASPYDQGLERRQIESTWSQFEAVKRSGDVGGLGDTAGQRSFLSALPAVHGEEESAGDSMVKLERPSFWSDFATVDCIDGKRRRFEPSSFPLVDGLSGAVGSSRSSIKEFRERRKGMLRGYGNAIVPQVAATFILASQPA